MVATEGSPVTLECRFSRRQDDCYLVWGYVPPGGNALKKLLFWSPGSQEPTFQAGDPHHHVATKDFQRSLMSLHIARTSPRDATRYFCQVTDHLWDMNATDWCGCGITLTVKPVRTPLPPRVRLLPPSWGKRDWTSSIPLTCEAVGFYPGNISIHWTIDGRPHPRPTHPLHPVGNSDGTYTAHSRIAIPIPEWDRVRRVSCLVSHISSTTPLIKTFMVNNGSAPDGHSISLTCGATGFYPATIGLGWEVDGAAVGSEVIDTGPAVTPNGTYIALSTLSTPGELWRSGAVYTCQITHQTQRQPIRKHISINDGCRGAGGAGRVSWLWLVAIVGCLVVNAGIILCVSYGFHRCGQRRRRSRWSSGVAGFSSDKRESLWENPEIPLEKIPAEGGTSP